MKTVEWRWKSSDGLDMFSYGWLPDGKIKAVVMLIHGMGEHIRRYPHVGAALTKKGYALIGFDLRGHGASGGQRGHSPSVDALFDDIDLFIKQIEERYPGLKKFIYGHSLGASLVLAYVPTRMPKIAGVISTSSAFLTSVQENAAKVAMARILGSVWPTLGLATDLDARTLSRDPKVVEAYQADPLVHGKISAGFGRSMLTVHPMAMALAERFPVPVLVMHGTKDQLAYPRGSDEWAALVPQDKVTLKHWIGFYHEIHNEPEQQQVFDYILAWLDAH